MILNNVSTLDLTITYLFFGSATNKIKCKNCNQFIRYGYIHAKRYMPTIQTQEYMFRGTFKKFNLKVHSQVYRSVYVSSLCIAGLTMVG